MAACSRNFHTYFSHSSVCTPVKRLCFARVHSRVRVRSRKRKLLIQLSLTFDDLYQWPGSMAAKKQEAINLGVQRKLLPIYPARGALIKEIKANINCVVVGETGSGKTTQIPQVAWHVCTFDCLSYFNRLLMAKDTLSPV